MQFSLGSPNKLLSALVVPLGWVFSFWAMLAGLFVIATGVGTVVSHAEKFAAASHSVLTPHNWVWLGLAWLGLKIVHELAHGLCCKYHRGEVREAGLVFILLAPMAYIDVTSCWRFPSKWQRIHVAAAGMYVELLLASVAAIVWSRVDSPVVNHLLYNVIVMASLSTLLFNANPLMRFDGYYILADLLEIPNLGSEASRFVKQLASRIFFGARMQPFELVGLRLWCVRMYGLASAAWRLLLCFSLATAASVLLHGAGLVLAFCGLFAWFGLPAWQVATDLARRFHEARASFVRALCVGCVLAVALALVGTQVPWPGAMTAPAIVEYAEQSIVRSRAAGFVTRVCVGDGELVTAGQLLLELSNKELESEQRELELALEQGKLRCRIALDEQEVAEVQVAERDMQAVAERLEEVQRRTAGLRVLAPASGRVIGRNLDQRIGSYLREGTEVLAIGDEQRKELIVSVGQQEVDAILLLVGEPARFRVGGRAARQGRLERLEPRASTELPHPALSSAVGGPLAVTASDKSQQTKLRLAEPRFRGVIALVPGQATDLGAGERGYALLGLRRESVGEYVWLRFSGWLESLLVPEQS